MEITAQVEKISPLITKKIGEGNNAQTFESVELVLNNGLERIACDTANSNLAKLISNPADKENFIAKGDTVRATVLTWASDRKTQSGEKFLANRSKVYQIKKIPDFREAPAF